MCKPVLAGVGAADAWPGTIGGTNGAIGAESEPSSVGRGEDDGGIRHGKEDDIYTLYNQAEAFIHPSIHQA